MKRAIRRACRFVVIPAQAGIGSPQCERTRAMLEQLRFLLSGTNRPIMAYQGNTMATLLRRNDKRKKRSKFPSGQRGARGSVRGVGFLWIAMLRPQ